MADLQPPSDAPANGVATENLGHFLGSKRQRRPSVRLGEIGEPSASAAISCEAYVRKNKQWKIPTHLPPKDAVSTAKAASSSKTRPLTNVGNGDSHETHDSVDEKNPHRDLDSPLIGFRKGKDQKQKRGLATGIKRVRSNWVSRIEEGVTDGEHEKLSGGDDAGCEDEDFQDYELEGSESPSKDQSPIRSMENTAVVDLRHGSEKEGVFPRRAARARVSDTRDPDAIELDIPSDMDGGDWRCGTSMERNGVRDRRCRSLDDGVRLWLNGLGLGRYAQVFEIHEVDDEVLPLLTLDDLKDMGINAVGSRRKMFCSVQKLRKGFT